MADNVYIGAVECLQKETAHLNIETFSIVLGQFRTDILSPQRRKSRSHAAISDYDSISEELTNRHEQTNGKQPGNPELAVERILDIVRREGMLKGCKTLPVRVALGSDTVWVMREKCKETLKILEEYEGLARSTDYPDSFDIPMYD
jgi:hypothetical protein